MTVRFGQTNRQKAGAAFTLVEVVMAMAILALVMAGMIYCYVESNRRAEWSALSLAAQASAVEAVEQARAAAWDVHVIVNDQLLQGQTYTNYTQTNVMLIPSTGQPMIATNFVTVSNINLMFTPTNLPMRQIRADCLWMYPYTQTWFTNTVITWRAPDE
jgi:prepilin-type N-terminal cleavage/methylation domain-containing protein